jgi:hypothetical protein
MTDDYSMENCPLSVSCQETIAQRWIRQDAVNKRLGAKLDAAEGRISDIQAHGFGLQDLITKQGAEFKEEREQTRQAVRAVATALANSDRLQALRHEKILDVQQRNLSANVELLGIFQGHELNEATKLKNLDGKILVNRVGHKAFIGLGVIAMLGLSGFIGTMLFPGIDLAFHAGINAFMALMPGHF